jgi:DNA-binding transcriptional LysR family regulator
MSSANWRKLDLNLLHVFHAVMQERHATRAARRLNMTQPAVSHALTRLRKALNDELFVRTPEGMEPTPRAMHLAEPVRRMLDELNVIMERADSFDPAKSTREFNIAVNNHAALVIAPALVVAIRSEAPGLKVNLVPSGTLDIPLLLDRGELDLVISGFASPAERFADMHLFGDVFTAVVRRGHPSLHEHPLTLEQLTKVDHLVLSSTGEETDFVDAELERHGMARRVALRAPLLSTAAILAQSDMVAILSERAARTFAAMVPLEVLALPFPSPKIAMASLWHRRSDDLPAHHWLRGIVHRTARREAGTARPGS